MLVAIVLRSFNAKHIKGCGERIGQSRGGSDDGGRKDLLRRPACARVEDVAVAFSLVMKELAAGAGGPQRLVLQHELRQPLVGTERMAQPDGPGEAGSRGSGLGTGGSGVRARG